MTGLILYARSRRILAALVVIAAVTGAGLALRSQVHQTYTASDSSIPWIMFLPLVTAVAITFTARSPLHDLDLTAARPLARWRLTTVIGLSLLATASLTVLAAPLSGAHGTTAAVRNLYGFLGLALLGGRLLQGRAAWVPPMTWCLLTATLGDPTSHRLAWDWPVRPDDDFTALCIAALLAVAGVVAAAGGTREVRAEPE
ncbi:hypothetical protein [Actinoplanes aureus]|uniref:Uncharacterized protein n=1 Tax=Actinoplanes aureus TaxID=2792083 RepID=A0A931CIJ8_9ACTN|nr:hypothetical protein [Actinoplanes aureus]MBG0568652.1 hypothetical protein [Actinoplanes aureus]